MEAVGELDESTDVSEYVDNSSLPDAADVEPPTLSWRPRFRSSRPVDDRYCRSIAVPFLPIVVAGRLGPPFPFRVRIAAAGGLIPGDGNSAP